LVFWEKNAIFRRKLAKIAENCDHNIDPMTSVSTIWSHCLGLFLSIRPSDIRLLRTVVQFNIWAWKTKTLKVVGMGHDVAKVETWSFCW
jgi:hypothetical protein